MNITHHYTVVENAGYEGENDRKQFGSHEKAMNWMLRNYRKGEIESLHVCIRKDFSDGLQTYDY